jgi:hypothetical protein
MLKNKRNLTIVSRIFDTINKMSLDKNTSDDESIYAETVYTRNPNYIVSVPNETQPLKMGQLNPNPITLCVYQVRTDGLYPYILFLLSKNNNEFSFIHFSGHCKKIKYAALSQMKALLPESNLAYAGFAETTEQTIIILKYTEDTISYISDEYIWATPFEIINKRAIGKSPVSKKVFDFFMENTEFLTLKTHDQRVYESPMIGYSFTCREIIEEMDIYRETILPDLGKCYYLLVDLPENSTKNIMRIAFFAGKMLMYDSTKNKLTYDSLLCDKKYYIIQNYDQHMLLGAANKIL